MHEIAACKCVAACYRNAGKLCVVNFSQCESPEEYYCYMVELSMISSIALATQETKNSWFVVVILHYAGNQWRELCCYLQETAESKIHQCV